MAAVPALEPAVEFKKDGLINYFLFLGPGGAIKVAVLLF
jgi:hypothetical protein